VFRKQILSLEQGRGYIFYKFVHVGVMNSSKINRRRNFNNPFEIDERAFQMLTTHLCKNVLFIFATFLKLKNLSEMTTKIKTQLIDEIREILIPKLDSYKH
jgi:hypothetical protein